MDDQDDYRSPDDSAEFYEAEELAAACDLPPVYEPDDFSYNETETDVTRRFPRHQRGRLLDLDLSLEQLRHHIDPTGERLGQIERLRHAWEAVTGASVSAHTQNLFLRGSELVVWLDSNLYAQQLPLFAREYCAGLERELGSAAVKTISYRVHQHRRH